jgi:hypothetical protein
MQIDVCAALELSPDRRIFVRDGEDADERIAVQNPEEQARYHLIENPAVRKLGPLEGEMCGLKSAGIGVGGADLGEIGGRGGNDVHWHCAPSVQDFKSRTLSATYLKDS